MSWSIPEPAQRFRDHPLLFQAWIGRKSAGRPPTSPSIGKFTGHRVRYQCHGVFPSRLNGLGTILYYFRRGSAARALDAPQPLHRSESSLDIELDTNVMEYSRAGSTV